MTKYIASYLTNHVTSYLTSYATSYVTSYATSYVTSYMTSYLTRYATSYVTSYVTSYMTSYLTSYATSYGTSHVTSIVVDWAQMAACLDLNVRDELIEQYFKLEYNHAEILSCLLLLHDQKLSLRQLKRILARRSLKRRQNVSDLRTVIVAIEQEQRGSGSGIGYRSVWQRLVTDHGLVVSKETVRHALRIIDPDGVDRRLRHRLQRSQYKGRGPNFLCHIDGYDKLKPFGFSINGCMDGYSRRIMWLEVGMSNNDPTVVAGYFVKCITEVGGTALEVKREDLDVLQVTRG